MRTVARIAVVVAIAAGSCDGPRGADPGLGLRAVSAPGLRGAFDSLPPGGEARVAPLFDNVDAWAARWRVLEGAEESIDVVTFALHDDPFGRSFLGLLAMKADEGVRVRLLVDSMGTVHAATDRIPRAALAALDRRSNVDVRSYNPVAHAIPDALRSASLLPLVASNHDKILIVDGQRSIVGGRNFADDYFADPADDPVVFLDKDVLVDGAATAAVLTSAFEREFFDSSTVSLEREPKTGDTGPAEAALVGAAKAMDAHLRARMQPELLPAAATASLVAPAPEQRTLPVDDAAALRLFPRMQGALMNAAPPPHRGEVRILDSCSQAGCRRNDINTGLGRLIEAAEDEIVIENPYLTLSKSGLQLLRDAGERGVRITLLTNSPASSDNALAQAVFMDQWPTILATVPNLRLYVMAESHNVHGKLLVVDGTVAAVGSYNLDALSAVINSEVVAVTWSPGLARTARANVLDTIARGAPHIREYTIERNADGTASLDDDGDPRPRFGPRDHCDPDQWQELRQMRRAVEVLSAIPGLSPLL